MKYYSIDLKVKKELELKDKEIPLPKDYEVQIQMKAWSLNYRDLLVRENAYNLPHENIIPISDGSGIISKVGDKVTTLKVGDKVCPIFMLNWYSGQLKKSYMQNALGGAINGLLSEYICLNENDLVKFPEHLTYEEAACLPCAGVTAFNAVDYTIPYKKDSIFLILGTGGVSTFALQFVSALGGTTIVTSKSDNKLEFAKKLGANYTINYLNNPNWSEEVLKLFPDGVSNIIEVGGAGTLNQSIEAVELGGTISLIGVLSGTNTQVNTGNLLRKNIRLQGSFVAPKECFEKMNNLITKYKIKPIIDSTFDFLDSKSAYDYLKSGNHQGKVVIKI